MFSVNNVAASAVNYIGDGIVILILLIALFAGSKKGFLGLIVGFLAGILTVVLTTLLCSPTAELMGNTFGLNATFENIYNGMFDGADEVFTTPIKELAYDQIVSAVNGLNLPQFIADALLNMIQAKVADVSIPADLTLQAVIVTGVTGITVTAIAWVTLFVLLSIIFAIIKRFVKIFDKIPIIGSLNKLLGALLMLIIAAFTILVIMYLFVMLSELLPSAAVDYVNQSIILKWLFNNNPLAQILTALFAK